MTTITAPPSSWTFQPPAWAITASHGRSGANEQLAWVSHEGAPITLGLPGNGGGTLITALPFQFSEETEPTQTYLRLIGGDDIDVDLVPAEVDTLIAATESWLTAVRAVRAVMVNDAEDQDSATSTG